MKYNNVNAQVVPVRSLSRVGQVSVLLSSLWLAGLAQAQLAIQSVTAVGRSGGEVVRIQTSQPLKQVPNVFTIQSPARIALDFPGATNQLGRNQVELNQGNLRSANVVEAGDRTRVVLNLNQSVKYETKLDGNALLVMLESAGAMPTVASSTAAGNFAPAVDGDVRPLAGVDFRRGSGNAGRVIVDLANNQTGVDIRQQGKSLVVEFMKSSLPEGLRRRMDVTDFGTPVQSITTTQSGDRVRMVIEPSGNWEHSAYQSDNQFVLEVREVKLDPNKLTQGTGYNGEKLSLNFQNIEIRALLQVIADFTNFNIITSDSVNGSVTLRLKDVPWDQALDIILQAKGLGMRKSGNVIWIAPKDELLAREKQDLEAKADVAKLEQPKTQSFQLNYAKALEVSNQLNGLPPVTGQGGAAVAMPTLPGVAGARPTRLLSASGSVLADPRTNQIFVTDIASKLEEVQALIKKIDVPVRQVMIEARIVEATDTFSKNLGVRLGAVDLRGVRGGDAGYSMGGNNRVAWGGSYDAVSSTTLQTTAAMTTANTSFVNLPAQAIGTTNPAALALSLFSPSANRFLNLEISALQEDGKGQVVASPRVITADQTKAEIEQGVELPYQSAASSGATTVSFRKASLRLTVTPHITPEGSIILDVEVNKDTPGTVYVGGVAVNTKRIQTKVLVENGGTVVIGGIYTSTEQDTVDKVPLLGDLPAVGNLFKSRAKQANKSELLVFLTPRTLTEAISGR